MPRWKEFFFRGDTKFETLFSNRKFYEFKDNLKRGLKKIRHGRNGHQSEKRCPVVEETKKSVSDNLDKPDNNTPCFNRFHTNSKEFETRFDHSNRSQNSDKAYLDNESCWNLSEKFIPFNNLKYEDLKHFEENIAEAGPQLLLQLNQMNRLIGQIRHVAQNKAFAMIPVIQHLKRGYA